MVSNMSPTQVCKMALLLSAGTTLEFWPWWTSCRLQNGYGNLHDHSLCQCRCFCPLKDCALWSICQRSWTCSAISCKEMSNSGPLPVTSSPGRCCCTLRNNLPMYVYAHLCVWMRVCGWMRACVHGCVCATANTFGMTVVTFGAYACSCHCRFGL